MSRVNKASLAKIKKNQSSKILEIPLTTWNDVGDSVAGQVEIKVRQEKVLGRTSRKYSQKYAAKKATNFVSGQSSNSQVVDLTLTGRMIDNLKRVRALKNGVELGMSNIHIKKMEANQDRGWDMLDDNLVLKPIAANVSRRLEGAITRNIKRWERDVLVFELGGKR